MFRSIIRRFIAWQKSDTAIMKLRSLDDGLLADMGIHRDQIRDIVHGRGVEIRR